MGRIRFCLWVMCGEFRPALIFVVEGKEMDDSDCHKTDSHKWYYQDIVTYHCLGYSTLSCVVVFCIDLFIVCFDGFFLDSDWNLFSVRIVFCNEIVKMCWIELFVKGTPLKAHFVVDGLRRYIPGKSLFIICSIENDKIFITFFPPIIINLSMQQQCNIFKYINSSPTIYNKVDKFNR